MCPLRYDMNTIWMCYLVMLAVGGLICFRGLSLYKLVQFLLCGWIGYFLAIQVCSKFSVEGTILLVIALAAGLVTGFLGFHFYKAGMYLSASVSAFLVVFSFFWRQAVEFGKSLLEQVNGAERVFASGSFFRMVLLGIKDGTEQNFLDQMLSDAGIYPELWSEGLEEILTLLKQGLFWAAAAGLVCGILALVFGDYVIILLTSVFGGMLLNLLVEQFIAMDQMVSTAVLAVFSVIGVGMQVRRKREKS